MDPAQLLREREHRLLAEYGASHPPKAFDAEDLQCEDPDTIEHWVGIYTELVDFVHSVIEPTFRDPAQPTGETPEAPRAIRLQAQVLELHLAYWTDRLNRVRKGPDTGAR